MDETACRTVDNSKVTFVYINPRLAHLPIVLGDIRTCPLEALPDPPE